MNIKRTRFWAAALLALGLTPALRAVDIGGGVSLVGASGPLSMAVAVSTYPLTDPALALDPTVYIASQSVSIPATTGAFNFTGLPFFGGTTTYYLYGFVDTNTDDMPNGIEIMGGFGPFAFNDPAALRTAIAPGDVFGSVNFFASPRAEVTGVVTNMSAQSGERLIVRVMEDVGLPNFNYTTGVDLSLAGGAYSIGGIKPSTNPFRVEAWIDTEPEGFAGYRNPDPYEDKAPNLPVGVLSAGATLSGQDIAVSSGAIGGSAPDHIRLAGTGGAWHMAVASATPSGDLEVSIRDFGDLLTTTGTPTAVQFSGYDGLGVFTPDISTDGFTTSISSFVIGAGQSFSPKFKFRYPGSGDVLLEARAVNFPEIGQDRFAYFSFTVLPAGSNFSGENARTTSDPLSATGTVIAISPDRDGVDDGAVLACNPPDPAAYWECVISTDPGFSGPPVQRFFGVGPGEAVWYGYGPDGRVVPNGTYYARFQTDGAGMVSIPLTVAVNTAFLRGFVMDAGLTPVAEADVEVHGPGGGGYARSETDGFFFVGGLAAGQTYAMTIGRPGFASANYSVAASSDVGNVVLGPAATLRVRATVDAPPPFDIYGSVYVHDAAFDSVAGGSLRLPFGSTSTDNGLPVADPQHSSFTALSIAPGIPHTVEVDLPQYGRFTATGVVVGPGATFDVSPVLTRRTRIDGALTFPAAFDSPFGGEWVSVDAVPTSPAGAPPVAWGGGFVNNGASSATYQLFGLSGGTYTLRAFVRGYVTNSTGPVVVTTGDQSGVDFPLFGSGGVATGTLTINGDTSGLGGGDFGGFGCTAGQVALPLNAHNPATFDSAFTQVCVSTGPGPVTLATYTLTGLVDGDYHLTAYLPGFQLSPPGLQILSVSGGMGTKDLTFDAFSGELNITATLPPGDLSGAVAYKLERDGPDRVEIAGNLAGPVGGPATATVSGLGTGLYTLRLLNGNPGRGLMRQIGVSVRNGATANAAVDMTVPTFGVAGAVDIIGNIVLPSTWSVVASSMAALSAVGVVPEILVYGFPLPQRFDNNTQPLRRVAATPWASSATFSVNGLPPGGYLFRVLEDLNPPTPPAGCGGCPPDPGTPEWASSDRVVVIGTAGASGVDLALTNGAKLSGAIRRPVGDDSTDSRHFVLRLRRTDNISVWMTDVNTTGAGTGHYDFSHLAPGTYLLETYEDTLPVKYAAPAKTIEIANGEATWDVDLVAAGTLVGRLRDADSGVLITPQNADRYLPDRFEISAEANPFVPGGYARAETGGNGSLPALDPNTGQFTIARLIPDATYDLTVRGFSDFGRESQANGRRTYAPLGVGGIKVSPGQTVDVGTLDLRQGGTLSGTVTDGAGAPLANVLLRAQPSLSNGREKGEYSVETLSDEDGHYEFRGIDRGQRYFDVIAAPRFRPGEVYAQMSGPKYAEERVRMIDVNDSTAAVGVDFRLTAATGRLSGTVRTADGGDLIPAFSDNNNQAGVRGANITLHFDGASLDQNPLGEIEEATAADGAFLVDGLKPGAYTFRAISRGYTTALKKIVVAPSGTTSAGTITLGLGATLSGAIAKPDGTSPSASELKMIVGVDQNFEDFVFGTIEKNEETQLVTGYALSGFQVGKNYSLVFVSAKEEVVDAAAGIVFSTTTESRRLDVVFRPAPPKVFVNQTRSGTLYTLRFFSSQPMRNLTDDDNDLSLIVTVSSGAGVVTDTELSPSRDLLTVVYDAPPAETSFALRLAFRTTVVDPDDPSGGNYLFDKTFEFFAGIGRRRSASIPNVTGGDCTLEGVPSGAVFPSGTFRVAGSSTVEVGIQSAVDLADLPASAPPLAGRAAAAARFASDTAARLGPSAYPVESLYRAVRQAPSVSPFSAFYDIFLPAGVSHMLKNEALLTLKYDDSVTDPSGLNIYYYDPNNNLYLLEKSQRVVDTVNKTITVGVSHLSTFVVLKAQAPIVGSSTYAGSKIFVHNTPNPFSLKAKTVTLTHTTPAQDQTTEGTVIAYGLPAGASGTVEIEIFDVAGARVRTLTQTAAAGGTYYYTDWDGRNDAGDRVASGVYLGRLTLNGADEMFFKMAVVK